MPLSTETHGFIIDPLFSFMDDKGKTIKNGFARVFLAGSSTPAVTYLNWNGAMNQETIQLDNSGRCATQVIGPKDRLYKVCIYDSHHSQETPILTVDNVQVLGTVMAILDGSVTTAKLSDEAVTTPKIHEGAVTSDKIADGSITTEKLSEGFWDSVSVCGIITKNFKTDFGAVGDGVSNDYEAFEKLAAFINARGGNCRILFPAGVYAFTPPYEPDIATWRNRVEVVDCQNVEYFGFAAKIKLVKGAGWDSSNRNAESPIQFRSSSAQRLCRSIRVIGLELDGDNVAYDGTDGNAYGVAFRAVENAFVSNCNIYGWGTDGIYAGSNYGNNDKGLNLTIKDCVIDSNVRQGISVCGVDSVVIDSCRISNTGGGSFGHAIDLEPITPHRQENIVITNCITTDNERGFLNCILTNDVIATNNICHENVADGVLYTDGEAWNITFENNHLFSKNGAAYYLNGSNVHDVHFRNNKVVTTGLPGNKSTVRINPHEAFTGIYNIYIVGNVFKGTCGIYARVTGDVIIEDNKFYATSEAYNNGTDIFTISLDGTTYNHSFKRNVVKIADDVSNTAATMLRIECGRIEDNEFSSNSNAVFYLYDGRSNSGIAKNIIGHNVFSEYFYYKGEVTDLDVKTEATIMNYLYSETTDDNKIYRRVHGGYNRVSQGLMAEVGDVCGYLSDSLYKRFEYICTEASSSINPHGTWKHVTFEPWAS